jgi:hypothetical protein
VNQNVQLSLCVALVGLGFVGLSNAQTLTSIGQATMVYDFSHERSPVWNNGALVHAYNNLTVSPTIHTFGRDGIESHLVQVDVQGAASIVVDAFGRGRFPVSRLTLPAGPPAFLKLSLQPHRQARS